MRVSSLSTSSLTVRSSDTNRLLLATDIAERQRQIQGTRRFEGRRIIRTQPPEQKAKNPDPAGDLRLHAITDSIDTPAGDLEQVLISSRQSVSLGEVAPDMRGGEAGQANWEAQRNAAIALLNSRAAHPSQRF